MPDLIFNSENAAASQDRGGLPEGRRRVAPHDSFHPRTPRAARSRGVGVFAVRENAGRAFRQVPPPATTRAAPARPAGLRIVET